MHGGLVGVELRDCDGCGRASYAGLVTCGSIWCCPLCAEKILAGRVNELLNAIDTHVGRGGRVVMVTLTMRHRHGQGLQGLWDSLGEGWRSASGGNRKTRRALADVQGWVRRVECTYGRNGWHLHVHVLLFVDGDVGQAAAVAMGDAMFDAWSGRLERDGLEAPIRDSGGLVVKLLDLTAAREDVAGYLAKGTYESAAMEMAAGLTKAGRRGNRTPFGVLADLVEHGRGEDLQVWREWERASHRRRAMTWKQGFRAQLLADVELTDEQLAEETDHAGTVVALLDGKQWGVVRDRWSAQLLEVMENSTADDAYDRLSRWLCRWGMGPPRRPPKKLAGRRPTRSCAR